MFLSSSALLQLTEAGLSLAVAGERWRCKPFKSMPRSRVGRKQTMAEASRAYRERIKQDPVKYHEYKLKDARRKRRKKVTESQGEAAGVNS